MKIVVQPTYEHLRSWLEQLPSMFSSTGEVIYDQRNQIRQTILPSGEVVCIKKFHCPAFLNGYIYGWLRPSKAQRSYEYGVHLMQHRIATPEPIAYIEQRQGRRLKDSYLITRASTLKRLYREWTLDYSPELELTIPAFAQFTAHMHAEGVLHLDYSPGNILWDKINGAYRFEIIDINRMRINHPVSMKEGAESLRRLCARTDFFHSFAREYAPLRGYSVEEFTHWILYFRNRFWKHGRKANYQYE